MCGNFESKQFLEDVEQGELVCRNCGRVSQLLMESKPATQANEPLGSIIGPSFEENSNHEFAASLQRIGNHLLPNYTEVKWKELIEELSDKAGIARQVREAVIQYHHHNRNRFKHANRREGGTEHAADRRGGTRIGREQAQLSVRSCRWDSGAIPVRSSRAILGARSGFAGARGRGLRVPVGPVFASPGRERDAERTRA